MSKSLQKFQTFLSKNNIIVRHAVCEKENLIFLIVFCENLQEFMIVTINPALKITKKDIDIPVDIITADPYSPIDEQDNLLNINYSMKEIDDNLKDDSQIIKDGLSIANYKEIVMSKASTDNLIYTQYCNQINKFKECVKNLKYKFGILTQDYITFIDRSNTTKNFVIKNKEHMIPIENTVFCICVDLENLFENINTLVEDSIKLFSSFYGILHDAHTKQTIALDSQVKLITDVPKQLEAKKNDLIKIQGILNQHLQTLFRLYKEENKLQSLKEFEERKKVVEQKDINVRDFQIKKISIEIDKVKEQKNKTQLLVSQIRKLYHQQLLSFDYNVFKGLQLFCSMAERIKKVL